MIRHGEKREKRVRLGIRQKEPRLISKSHVLKKRKDNPLVKSTDFQPQLETWIRVGRRKFTREIWLLEPEPFFFSSVLNWKNNSCNPISKSVSWQWDCYSSHDGLNLSFHPWGSGWAVGLAWAYGPLANVIWAEAWRAICVWMLALACCLHLRLPCERPWEKKPSHVNLLSHLSWGPRGAHEAIKII